MQSEADTAKKEIMVGEGGMEEKVGERERKKETEKEETYRETRKYYLQPELLMTAKPGIIQIFKNPQTTGKKCSQPFTTKDKTIKIYEYSLV